MDNLFVCQFVEICRLMFIFVQSLLIVFTFICACKYLQLCYFVSGMFDRIRQVMPRTEMVLRQTPPPSFLNLKRNIFLHFLDLW